MNKLVGENNPNWKGNRIGYYGIHKWLSSTFGKANKCENLDCKKLFNKFEWAKLKSKKYERKRKNFWMLCSSCHKIQKFLRFLS